MKTTPKTPPEIPVILFAKPKNWEAWLKANHAESKGLWLRLAKKNSGIESINYAEALDVALCYGWIDGQKKSYDDATWLQKFTPRGAKSIWSKINREKVEALIESKRMKPAGLKAIESAKQDGRWDAAYDSQSKATVPEDFQAALDQNAKAKAFFATLKSVNRYAILFRIQTAKKAETRAKRIRQFIEMLEKHETIHP
ncbi:MAG: YdeI/OmpD-associated family protein [Acidobacteriota bacterium]